MIAYLLDTNTVSHFLNSHPIVDRHMVSVPKASVGVSVITEAEWLFGLAQRPEATQLQRLVRAFLREVDVAPFE